MAGKFSRNKIATRVQISVVAPNTGKTLKVIPRPITKANFIGLNPCFNNLVIGGSILFLKLMGFSIKIIID